MTADDRLDILDLCARYNLTLDDKDLSGFMSCWADGTVRLEAQGAVLTDRKAIRSHFEQFLKRIVSSGKRRIGANYCLRDGEQPGSAYVTCDLLFIEVQESPRIAATGRYDNSKVTKTDKGWKFVFRKLESDPGFREWLKETLPG